MCQLVAGEASCVRARCGSFAYLWWRAVDRARKRPGAGCAPGRFPITSSVSLLQKLGAHLEALLGRGRRRDAHLHEVLPRELHRQDLLVRVTLERRDDLRRARAPDLVNDLQSGRVLPLRATGEPLMTLLL